MLHFLPCLRYNLFLLVGLHIVPATAHSVLQVVLGDLLVRAEIACSDLGVNLHSGIRRDEVVYEKSELENTDKTVGGAYQGYHSASR